MSEAQRGDLKRKGLRSWETVQGLRFNEKQCTIHIRPYTDSFFEPFFLFNNHQISNCTLFQ